MKKIKTIFGALIVGFFLFGGSLQLNAQVLYESFALMTDSTTTDISASLDSYTSTPGWTGSKVYQSTEKAKIGTSSAKGFITTPALNLAGNGGNFTIRFKARRWPNDQTQMKVFVNTTEYLVTGLNTTDMNEFTVIATGGTAATTIKFEAFQAAASRFFIDDIEIVQTTNPVLIFAPSSLSFGGVELNGNMPGSIVVRGANLTAGQNITVAIAGAGFTTTTTTLSTNTLMTPAGETVAVNFNPTAVQDYTGTLTFTGGGLTGPVTYNLSGSGINVISVATIAELKAAAPSYTGSANNGTTVYKYSGEAVVTHLQTYNNVKYIQDATGAMMIFDPTAKISGVNLGDKITNVYGTLTNYFGMIELIPTANCTPLSPFNTVDPTIITIDQLDADNENPLQSKLIKIENVTFIQSGNFATAKYYGLTQNALSIDSLVYTDNFGADYINTAIPNYVVNLTGVCFYKGGATIANKNRIVLINRNLGGITTSIEDFSAAAIALSPNPADNFVNLDIPSAMSLEIYSVTGALVGKEKLTEGFNTISVANLNSGLYMLRLTDLSGKTYRAKLQVK
jgi:hypothetical protein